MFTIEAQVDKTYELAARRPALHKFFADPENFSRHMPDIVSDVEPLADGCSIWTLMIDLSSGSPLTVKIEMEATQSGESKLSYEPHTQSQDYLAIYIDMKESGAQTNLHFILELRLERKSSFDIHPLAGLLGERSISKLVERHAGNYVDEFVDKAKAQAVERRTKKR